ncbi:hypothetical protein ANCCAN_18801 [Ancylostoma caninum]|uniref:Uncharacterized protein n=1 Tax=Ancylostoma caninum TaxID=29170 RepID=A0A368FSY6_ANCCA|nr:hypothetical protein ANCCAN_18801 [Ancylostoma caninum]
MASDYLNDPAYLLPQTYGLIKGVVEKRSDIDKELDMAFKNHDWGYLKLIERMGIKIPSMYGCYFEEKKWSKPVLACVYDTRVWRSDF